MKKAIWLLLLLIIAACGPSTAQTTPNDKVDVEEDSATDIKENEAEDNEQSATTL